MNHILLSILVATVFLGCSDEGSNQNPNEEANTELTCKEKIALLELDIQHDLDTINTDTDFTLSIKSNKGNEFTYSVGNSTPATMYKSASTSKMVTAAVILDLVDKGILSLDDTPSKYISTWATTGNMSTITLRDLLSFTSGLTEAPLCNFSGSFDFESCVNNILSKNPNSPVSGTEFYYGPNHLQVAGLMAMKATHSPTWNTLFNAFKTEHHVFATSTYDLPSATNPKLAGGMHWNANEYRDFLEKLYNNELFSAKTTALMMQDQIASATIVNSPALNEIKEDWHYGFGVWIESHSNPFDANKLNGRISSPGLYGAYPFIDYTHKYYGILARQGAFNTFEKGYRVFSSFEAKLEQWADTSCD